MKGTIATKTTQVTDCKRICQKKKKTIKENKDRR